MLKMYRCRKYCDTEDKDIESRRYRK